MNVFAEIGVACTRPGRYEEFLNNRKRKVFGYILFLTLVYFILTIVVPLVRLQLSTGGLKQVITEYIPDFVLEDGTLYVEDVVDFDDGQNMIYIDTDPSYDLSVYTEDDWRLGLIDYDVVFWANSQQMVIKNNGKIQILAFENAPELAFSRDQLMGYVPMAHLIVAGVCLFIYIFQVISICLGAVLVALISMITASFLQEKLTFGELFLLGVYARTLPLLIKGLLSLIPFGIWMYGFISLVISCVYVGFALSAMKQREQAAAYESQNQYNGW